jgi:hypothetical protein
MSDNRFFDPNSPNRYTILYADVKEEVFRLLDKGVKLDAHWDAGGDQTPGGINFTPESANDGELNQALFWTIIRALDLPGAGETYDEGTGEIFRGEEGSLKLKFTSRERGYNTTKERPDETFLIPIDDLAPLHDLQHRARIYMSGKINDFGNISAHVRVEAIEGEEIIISEEEEEKYKDVIAEVLHTYSHTVELEKVENPQYENEYIGGDVDVDFEKFVGDEAKFLVRFYYDQVVEHKDEVVVLIDAFGGIAKLGRTKTPLAVKKLNKMLPKSEAWNKEQQKIKTIKDEVLALHEKGIRLFYEWDAGGDSTLCWPVTVPKVEISDALQDELYKMIRNELALPNAGDDYNKGKGEIFFTADNALALRFSAEETTLVYDEEYPEEEIREQEIEAFEDVGHLQRFLDRGNVFLRLNVNWKKETTFSVDFNVTEGDVPFLMPNEEDYYRYILLPYTDRYTRHFQQKEKGYFAGKINLTCRLSKGKKPVIMIHVNWQYAGEFINTEVILLA